METLLDAKSVLEEQISHDLGAQVDRSDLCLACCDEYSSSSSTDGGGSSSEAVGGGDVSGGGEGSQPSGSANRKRKKTEENPGPCVQSPELLAWMSNACGDELG